MEAAIKTHRHGTFSSSSMWKLMTYNKAKTDFGAPGLKYIKQVGYEHNLGRAVSNERDARQTSWGKFVQHRVFDLLGMEYTMIEGETRYYHPTIPYWSGVPDTAKFPLKVVGDIKCPYNLEVFADKIEALEQGIEVYKSDFDDDYWQHISNAILLRENGHEITHFEAILYVPYQHELAEIREQASMFDGDQVKIAFINWSTNDDELPYLIEGMKYKNLNVYSFPIDEDDVNALTERVKLANSRLTALT
jgi:hypothetical protein